jgi:sugar phosphate isomerase/epimerase
MMALFGRLSFGEALDRARAAKLEAVEIGAGNYPGSSHCPVKELLASKAKARDWAKKVADRGLVISALACHGNPLHPDKVFAARHHGAWRDAVKLASMVGVDTITCFSGCPGGSDGDKYPNWVVCSWPQDFVHVLDWQWSKKILPYWKREARFAAEHGVKIAFEMHQGMAVYNTETLLRLRKECGDNVGANFDPSHLFWQGMDPLAAIRELGGGVIFHTHAKDTRIDARNAAVNGTLDTKSYGRIAERSWVFRTVGYGHGPAWWRDFISALRMVGYDGAISIEHEDGLMSVGEGFQKAVELLRSIIIREQPGAMWWA